MKKALAIISVIMLLLVVLCYPSVVIEIYRSKIKNALRLIYKKNN